jgi:hypothetical protein
VTRAHVPRHVKCGLVHSRGAIVAAVPDCGWACAGQFSQWWFSSNEMALSLRRQGSYIPQRAAHHIVVDRRGADEFAALVSAARNPLRAPHH